MKLCMKLAAQGDVVFRRIPALPKGVTEEKRVGKLIVAHSETGHHHSIHSGEVKMFRKLESDALVCYLQLEGVDHCDVVHERPFDTHETIRLLGGPGAVWEIRRQREYVPNGWRRVED